MVSKYVCNGAKFDSIPPHNSSPSAVFVTSANDDNKPGETRLQIAWRPLFAIAVCSDEVSIDGDDEGKEEGGRGGHCDHDPVAVVVVVGMFGIALLLLLVVVVSYVDRIVCDEGGSGGWAMNVDGKEGGVFCFCWYKGTTTSEGRLLDGETTDDKDNEEEEETKEVEAVSGRPAEYVSTDDEEESPPLWVL